MSVDIGKYALLHLAQVDLFATTVLYGKPVIKRK
jgi:hypothetical protein